MRPRPRPAPLPLSPSSATFAVAFALIGELIGAGTARAAPTALTVDDYLTQVGHENRALRSATEASSGAELREGEGRLVYSPVLSAEYQRLNDHKLNALFPGAYRKIYNDVLSVGLSQQTTFGTQAKVSYTLADFLYVGSQPRFYEGTPRLELSQQLWGGGFGSSVRAQAELTEASARAARFSQSYTAKALRSQAENAYIALAAARELRESAEESLKRAKEIFSWNDRRYRLSLGEDSDLLQAQANLESNELRLQQFRDSERSASREFNRLRNLDSDEVAESLALPTLAAEAPAREAVRDDVQAAIENARLARAQAALGTERSKPTLEVFGSVALNSRERERGDALTNSFHRDYPTTVVGVRLQTPLAFGTAAKIAQGYGKEAVAAEIDQDRRLFDQEVQWRDLVLKLAEAKRRYAIARKLEDVQKRKATAERLRLRRGRTTTYQSLLFDEDQNQAEAARVQAQAEVLQIVAQMKTFGGR